MNIAAFFELYQTRLLDVIYAAAAIATTAIPIAPYVISNGNPTCSVISDVIVVPDSFAVEVTVNVEAVVTEDVTVLSAIVVVEVDVIVFVVVDVT